MPFLALVLGTLILFTLIFLWLSKKNHRTEKKAALPELDPAHPGFKEEFSTELTPPVYVAAPPAEPELPHYYGVDRLVLLARDPYWLYAYWEITATKQEEFTAAYGPAAWTNSRPVLRVYDVTGVNPDKQTVASYVDIGINEEADNWHINVGEPDHTFYVDLGRRFPDGRFVTLLRSNVVTTPRASLSERTDEEWMWIEGIYRTYRYQFGLGSPLLAEEMAERAGALPLGIASPGQWQKE
ncbi:MAG: DUF4912 domain-containing protein [Bacillota bacterium]